MADAAQGYAAKLAMDPASPIDTMSEPYEFLTCTLAETIEVLDASAAGIRGTRSRHGARTREGNKSVAGAISLNPSPADLDLLLPRILGAAESSDTFALADTLPSFVVGVDYGGTDAFEFGGCYVNRATFRASAGGLLELALDILGKTKTDLTYPSLTLPTDAHDAPYVFTDGVLTLVSSAREMTDVEVVVDNALDARFVNSQTATSITPRDRIVTLRATLPYNADNDDVYTQGTTAAAATLVFTNGNLSLTFSLTSLRIKQVTPSVNAKGEITLRVEGETRMSGATRELVVTSDSTA
jgi:hypothetical protein